MQEVIERIVQAVPRDFFLLAIERLTLAYEQAYTQCSGHHEGHRAHAIGQARHFRCNESLVSIFAELGIKHRPLSGTKTVQGEIGNVSIGRFNMPRGEFERVRRSKGRLDLAALNEWVTALHQLDLFGRTPSCDGMGIFIVTVPTSSWANAKHPEAIWVIVTDHDFRTPLYKASVTELLAHYAAPAEQEDRAFVRLKSDIASIKRNDSDNGT